MKGYCHLSIVANAAGSNRAEFKREQFRLDGVIFRRIRHGLAMH